MDIASLKLVSASENGADLDLLNPFDGESTGATLHVTGFDAPRMIAAAREFDREQAASEEKMDADDLMRLRRAHLAVAAVTEWAGFGIGEDETKFTPAKARKILMDPEYQWICEQVWRFGAARRNFTPKPKSVASSGRGTSDT